MANKESSKPVEILKTSAKIALGLLLFGLASSFLSHFFGPPLPKPPAT